MEVLRLLKCANISLPGRYKTARWHRCWRLRVTLNRVTLNGQYRLEDPRVDPGLCLLRQYLTSITVGFLALLPLTWGLIPGE